jgi:hypothetical protein
MAIVENSRSSVQPTTNGAADIEGLHSQIRELQEECSKLKQALASSEDERIRYRQAFLDQARAAREFEDVDIVSLEKMSAGPVELLE